MDEMILERIKKGIQYRDMTVGIGEEERKIVKGYATTFNDPYVLWEDDDYIVYEQISERAFDKADMSDVIMQYNHVGRVFARTRNNTLTLRKDAKGLFIEADLGGTEIGRALYEEIRGGYTDKMSFAFTVTGDTVDRRTENNRRVITRTITEIGKVYDVSAVSYPANNGTTISARSFCDGIIRKDKEEALAKIEAERMRQKISLKIKLMGGIRS